MRLARYGTILLTVTFLLPVADVHAQSSLDLMDVDIMFVGAHPDDDTGVLATFARYLLDEGFKGTVVTVTGGDGGGNAIGPEAGRSLALIRKEEERRALAMVGVESPSFLGLTDFYFTLSAEETARKWGASFVCDVVRHVRLERPEVIITMWPGPGTHGQHQMAARAATIAFDKAADPSFCPELTEREHLATFQPLKLYYYNRDGATTMSVPTETFSRARNRRYSDIRALAASLYRSQGFDQFIKIPVEEARPERFMLIRSRVPVSEPETHLLQGALLPAGSSPPGIILNIEPERFQVGAGVATAVAVTFANNTPESLDNLRLHLNPPDGWTIDVRGETTVAEIGAGGSKTARFELTPARGAVFDRNARVTASYEARLAGRPITGSNFTWLQARSAVSVRFQPLFDVAAYREFARDTQTEWVIETLPARVPLYIGRINRVNLEISNDGAQRRQGDLRLDLPPGVVLRSAPDFAVGPGETVSVPIELEVDEAILPEGRHSAKLPMTVSAVVDGTESSDTADVFALPTLTIPRVDEPPVIDGDLEDMRSFPGSEISPNDLWWRREPVDAADASGLFHLAYGRDYLYVGVQVRDETVVCNIAPDDVRAQLRSDAIGVTVDPSGASEDTSTVLQAAAFPCTTAGFGARGFRDADANQGLMEQTAPGMEVASRRTSDGYTFEARIPWAAMPRIPSPGDEIGVNIILYDGDQADARVGANISESGLGWAAFEWGGKQALPYLWPRVVLQP